MARTRGTAPAREPGPLRVLVCTQGFPRHEGDHHAPFVADHARALLAAGASVRVLCPSAPGLATHDHLGAIEVTRFRYAPHRYEVLAYTGAMHRRARGPAALLLVPFLVASLVATVREAKDADVLHAFWWMPSGLVAVIAGRLTGVPVVVHILGTDAALTRGPVRLLARWVLRRADAVEAMSTDLARWCTDVAGVEARVAPMPLGGAQLPPPSPPPVDGPVLAVGRLVPEKGFDLAIRAVAATGDTLEIAGDGDQRPILEALARETGADVRFLGPLAPEALAGRYAAARLVVVPSRREGFGMVAAEAAAAGRAVVAFDVGGLSDTVSAANGALVAPGDVTALADALRSTDPTLGRAGPAAVTRLAPDHVAAGALAVYGRVTPSGRRPLLRPLLVAGAAVTAVVVLALCARSLAHSFSDARALHLTWTAGPLLRAGGLALVAGLVLASTWTGLVRALGGRLGWGTGARIWWVGTLGRYVPTGLGSLPARVALARRSGIATRPAVAATGAETAALPLCCFILWLATVLGPVGPIAALVVLGAGAVALQRWLKVPGPVAVAYLATIVGQVALRGLGVGALVGLTGRPVPGVVTLVGAAGSAYLLGLLAVFAPAGLGVRETVLASALAPAIGAPAATAAAIAWRVVESVVELLLVLGTQLVHTGRGRRGARIDDNGVTGD